MKRLIELPDEVVKAIQNGEDYRYDIHTAIAQSTPYNLSGDCISRSELKQMIPAPIEDEYKLVHRIIDNAPPVPERPQGAWIKDNSGDRFCSECGSCALYHEIGLKIESRFCPNCGADMRGKENEKSN